MNRIPAALAFGCALIWASTANAGCMSEMQCDNAGTCTQVETCDGVLDMAQTSPDAMTPIPVDADPLAVTPVAAATATDAGCRQVDICGTMTMVCD